MNLKEIMLFLFSLFLVSCVSRPPADVDNVCHIFREYPQWYWATQDVAHRWKVPISVQMAILHQESKFDGTARPPRTKLFWVIPWMRPTTAYGYSQALNGTWALYKRAHDGGTFFASRTTFEDAVDFVGWYANQANRRAGISRRDAYSLYLAYHEGVGGYQAKTYLRKPWLVQVARKVKARSQIYHAQLRQCRRTLKSKPWYK